MVDIAASEPVVVPDGDGVTGVEAAGNTRIVFDSDHVIRLRTGIWNFTEAVIDVSEEPAAVADTVRAVLAELAGGGSVDPDQLPGDIGPVDGASVTQLLSDLVQAGFLVDAGARQVEAELLGALLGNARPFGGTTPAAAATPGLLLTDSATCSADAARLAGTLGMPLTVASPDTLQALARHDLTSRTDGHRTDLALDELAGLFEGTGAVLACFRGPSVALLRNLNRVVRHLERPLVAGIIDGPFLSLVGTRSPYTGCFECFEQRSLARLEDHVTYHRFAAVRPTAGEGPAESPLLGLLTNLVVTEGFLLATVGTTRFSGRALNIYLPTLEIQVQDVLRMPGCPACGQIASQRLREINFSTRVVVDSIVSEALT